MQSNGILTVFPFEPLYYLKEIYIQIKLDLRTD